MLGKWLFAYLFDCVHRNTTWPHSNSSGLEYVCCIECGRELPYSTRRMSIVSEGERLEDRYGYTKGTNSELRGAKLSPNFGREHLPASLPS
jgi:hypothetical protein